MMVVFALSVNAKDIKELIVTTTPPMSCQNCENKIKGNLRFEKGVKNIETNLADQRVTVTYDADKTNPEKIEQAFKKIGYSVEEIPATIENNCETPASCEKEAGNNCVKSQGCNGSCCGN